jgi:phosphatidylserine/phosphatidylglycerophosphate/cardiolipin synthase-like enzyme
MVLVVSLVGCIFEEDDGLYGDFIPREDSEISVYFCPKDNCSLHLVNFIDSAKEYVNCAFFDLDLKEVINKLALKSQDVEVRLVIDNNNYDGSIKGNIVVDTNSQLSHNKFCVVDGKKILTGSMNPTDRGAYYNNNNLIIVNSKYLARNYDDEFNELWGRNFSKGSEVKFPVVYLNNQRVENYFCPEDECAKHVIDIINKAEQSIYFMTFTFTNEDIADAILFKDVDIKGVFEARQVSKYSQFERLKDFGLDVKKDKNGYNMHHKVFIIDNKTVITGSFNPTKAGDNRNDENVLIIHDKDIAKKYLEEFEYLWNLQ